ncbi:GntR family transcriptional regulator [Rhodococcus sp. BL-253-APC-6A1W]|uniref:GntR family transcriptional regulator n=1 Tax=unclassified Rhodococcus (in: high G+C Gram-positive bacteria) TaxID=192944 RepID=UPI00146F82F9|nr:GntR family transcriptional regulator [Rhodococcus sp. BL-253-APC-6A1W]NMD94061.1 GntR family transcriptional regulator [Rhodococcus sp. BL-253-APC-6A1W]
MRPGVTRREQVYRALRTDLMSGDLTPDERLSEERLAEHYGVSRTPVREALARLVSDGLVERREYGLFPYRPRLEDLAGLYELRITLELRGIRRAQDDDSIRHDPDILGPELDRWYGIRRNLPEPDAGFVTLDEQFHLTMLAASGNRALCDALAVVNQKVRPVRMFDYLTPDRISDTVDEHIAVAELVLDNRLDDAHRMLLEHIGTSRTVVVRRSEEALNVARLARAVRE